MGNRQIAIKWAKEQVKAAKTFVYSDGFFAPFSGSMCNKITQELKSCGITVWHDTKQGAFLFRSNDPRLKVSSNDTAEVGAWCDEENANILILPVRLKQ